MVIESIQCTCIYIDPTDDAQLCPTLSERNLRSYLITNDRLISLDSVIKEIVTFYVYTRDSPHKLRKN